MDGVFTEFLKSFLDWRIGIVERHKEKLNSVIINEVNNCMGSKITAKKRQRLKVRKAKLEIKESKLHRAKDQLIFDSRRFRIK